MTARDKQAMAHDSIDQEITQWVSCPRNTKLISIYREMGSKPNAGQTAPQVMTASEIGYSRQDKDVGNVLAHMAVLLDGAAQSADADLLRKRAAAMGVNNWRPTLPCHQVDPRRLC
jgi:hypothetical protein